MFEPNKNQEGDRRVLKCEIIKYSPAATSTINTAYSQLYVNNPREISVISLTK